MSAGTQASWIFISICDLGNDFGVYYKFCHFVTKPCISDLINLILNSVWDHFKFFVCFASYLLGLNFNHLLVNNICVKNSIHY